MTTTLEKRPARRSNSALDKFFRNDFLFRHGSPEFWDGFDTIPSVNMKEEKNNYIVEMAAPGLKKEDFNINVEGDLLTISCEKETETKENDSNYTRKEYNYSSFSRTVTLPDYADSKAISAKYNDGVLNLVIPKKPEAQKMASQKIKVQ